MDKISTRITEKVFESSPVREVSDVMTIGTDAFEEVYDFDEPDSGFVGEQEARTYAAIKICKARLAYIKIMELARKELPPEAFED